MRLLLLLLVVLPCWVCGCSLESSNSGVVIQVGHTHSVTTTQLCNVSGDGDVPIQSITLYVSGRGSLLLHALCRSGSVVDTLWRLVDGHTLVNWTLPAHNACGAIDMLALGGPLVLHDVNIYTHASILSSVTAAQIKREDIEHFFSPALDVYAAWSTHGNHSSSLAYDVEVTTAQESYTLHTNTSSHLLQSLLPNTTVSVVVHPYLPLLNAPGRVWGASLGAKSAPMDCPPGWGISEENGAECAPCPAGSFNWGWLNWPLDSACAMCPSYSWSTSDGSPFCFSAVAHWAFNPRYSFNDTSDHGHDGIPIGDVSVSSTEWKWHNGSLASTGSPTSYVQVEKLDFFCEGGLVDCSVSTQSQNSWTVAFWFHPSIASYHGILSDWAPGSERFYARFHPNGTFEWMMRGRDDTPYMNMMCPNAAHVGAWTHLALVLDQFTAPGVATLTLFINASIACQTTIDSSIRIATHEHEQQYWAVGAAPTPTNGTVGFTGWLDEVWIMSGALSPEMVQRLMVENTLLEYPPN